MDDEKKSQDIIGEKLDNDIISEVGNILSHNSANAFSELIRDSIKINTQIDFISITDFNMGFIFTGDFANLFEGLSDNIFEGFFLKTSLGAEGISLILFHRDHVNKLIQSVAPEEEGSGRSEQDKIEILKEFSNITMHAYLNALGKLINESIESSMPIPAKDVLGTLYDFKEALNKNNTDKALLISTSIEAENSGIKGKLIILLKPDTFHSIVDKLKKESG